MNVKVRVGCLVDSQLMAANDEFDVFQVVDKGRAGDGPAKNGTVLDVLGVQYARVALQLDCCVFYVEDADVFAVDFGGQLDQSLAVYVSDGARTV